MGVYLDGKSDPRRGVSEWEAVHRACHIEVDDKVYIPYTAMHILQCTTIYPIKFMADPEISCSAGR
jgi:hypothetical protein